MAFQGVADHWVPKEVGIGGIESNSGPQCQRFLIGMFY